MGTGTVVVVVLVVIVVEATVVGSLVVEAFSGVLDLSIALLELSILSVLLGVLDLPIAILELSILSIGVKDVAFTIIISVVEVVADVVLNAAL